MTNSIRTSGKETANETPLSFCECLLNGLSLEKWKREKHGAFDIYRHFYMISTQQKATISRVILFTSPQYILWVLDRVDQNDII